MTLSKQKEEMLRNIYFGEDIKEKEPGLLIQIISGAIFLILWGVALVIGAVVIAFMVSVIGAVGMIVVATLAYLYFFISDSPSP